MELGSVARPDNEKSRAKIDSIYRFPVKGLSAQPLRLVSLSIGQAIPADRLYAIENGPSGFDPVAPSFFPKTRFLMLMKNERLAELVTDYEEKGHTLTIKAKGYSDLREDLRTASGRAKVEKFFAEYCRAELKGSPKILYAPGHTFSDVAKKVVSIINMASLKEIEKSIGVPIDPLRFRANVYVSDWPPWHEFRIIGRTIAVGSAELKVFKRIVRCAATNVDPKTGLRDLELPNALISHFGHGDCGIYAEVSRSGSVQIGDEIVELD